jgi:PDZ domain-containing protein
MRRDVVSIVFLVGVVLAAPLEAPSPYMLVTPGGTYDIGSRLRVPDDQRRDMGRMAFTAVYELDSTWLDVLRARARDELGSGGPDGVRDWLRESPAEIVPAVDIRPPGTTQQQVNETNKRLIDESKPVAAVVGLRAAGYDVAITGQGAEVQSLLDGMPAQSVLRVGDIIVAVDGQPTPTTSDLQDAVRRHAVGQDVRLTIRRDGQDQEVVVGTRESPTEPGRPLIGVSISTYLFDVRLPFPVDVESDNVGGPSAGFMFALGILDAVTEGDLTRGNYVAGTGTISQDGSVGPVGGAAEKAVAAEEDGAQIFLVPRANLDEARRWVHSLQVVPVDRLDDAVRFLCGLQPATGAVSAEPPKPCA